MYAYLTNSLYSKKKRHELNSFLIEHRLHIVLLCETKLTNRIKIHFKNYVIIRSDRITNSDTPSGGTAILLRNNLKFSTVNPFNS